MSGNGDRAIEVEGLVKQFKKGPLAVDGIDLHVDPGEIYGFLGPNGAGKSTTVLMLTTLLPPTGGTARVAGFDVAEQGAEVRQHIGAALQEAALDPYLTAREHMRLQTALHGLPRAERKRRGNELIDRVGLSEAADRKVGGYSGGMRRRLDLALALVHGPRILFLDEPTTGLDPQSRTSLWEEVERLSSEDGVTVFLTTQYLEEADQLADRVGIIDDGKIVAEGTPARLKAEIADPSVEAIPADPRRCDDVTRILAPFGGEGEEPHRSGDGIAVRLAGGESSLADVVRALDAENVEIAHLQLHAPSLDDVFLAKTGRTLEGAGEGEDTAEASGGRVNRATWIQIGALARRSFVRTLRQPAQVVPTVIFPLFLVAVNTGGLEAATELPGFPTSSYLSFAIAVPFIQAAIFAVNNGGADLARDIETGFFDRLALTPMSGGALIVAQLAGVVALGVLQSLIYLVIGVAFGASFDAGIGGVFVLVALALVIMFAFGCVGLFFAFRTGSSEAVQGLFPVLFVFLFLSSGSLPRDLIEQDWFRTIATYNPVSYLIEGIRSLFITGWDGEALALAFACAGGIAAIFMVLAATSLRTRLTRT